MKSWKKRIERGCAAGIGALCLTVCGCASFELTSIPENVEIYEGQVRLAATPYGFEQFSGERTFTLKKEGYVEKDITISSLDQHETVVQLERVRTTTLNTVPTDVQVVRTSNGKLLGRTSLKMPLSRVEVVILEKEGYKPHPMSLEPNRTYKVDMEPLEGFKSIFFTSKPKGAFISDRTVGDMIAQTPSTVSAEEGTEFEFTMEGYQPTYYMLNKRSSSRVFIELIPVPTVTLHSLEGSAVYGVGGGEKLGDVPFTQQIKTVRAFEVRKEGYYPATVTVSPESPPDIAVELEAIPLKTILTEPAGAQISRIGQREVLGTAPLQLLAKSERLLEISAEGYARRTIGIGPDSPAQITIKLQPLAKDRLMLEGIQHATITVF